MSTEPAYCFEHAPSHTIVRSTQAGNQVQIIRDHKILGSYSAHMNYQMTFAPNGLVYYTDDYGHGNLVDLNQAVLQPPVECKADGHAFYPDGEHLLDYSSYYKTGVVKRSIRGGEARVLCPWSDLAKPRPILLFGQSPTVLKEKVDDFWDITKPIQLNPHSYVAEDNETWALVTGHRMEIGRDTEHLASLYWQEHNFFHGHMTFDLPNQRCILAGEPGLVALSLTGEVLAQWQASLPCEPYTSYGQVYTQRKAPVVSPVTFWNGMLLAVVQVRQDQTRRHEWYEVLRFDPQTLQPLGKLAGFPRRPDPDGTCALLPLADGSLAWVPHSEPLIILPAPGANRKSTNVVQVLNEPLAPRISPPTAEWYDPKIGESGYSTNLPKLTPEQRQSLAYYFLNETGEDHDFTALVDMAPEAFAPYLESVSGWSFDQLRMLRQLDGQNYWKIMRGASNSAFDRIAAPLLARMAKQRKFSPEDKLRAMLLIGVNTPYALAQIGDMARQSSELAELCASYHLMIPASGPAIRRCASDYLDIVAHFANQNGVSSHQSGLEYPLAHAEFLPETYGWSCRSPQGHILTAALDLIPGQPLASSPLRYQHWFLPVGEKCCDERKKAYYTYQRLPDSDKLVELVANLADPQPTKRPTTGCKGPGRPAEASKYTRYLRLEPYDPDRWSNHKLGRLGGYPEWRQNSQIPTCPECDRMMFYVGWVKADTLRDDLIDVALYGFHCEQCGVGVQVVQK